jgi:thiosulfate reductase cytochrome b subunit
MTVPAQTKIAPPPLRNVQLHPLSRRVMHWINAAAIVLMIASGWRIYDSNPFPELPIHIGFPLSWTLGGYFPIDEAANNDDGLAVALLWHFAAMWVLLVNFIAYLTVGFLSGHFRRDFLPLSVGAFTRDFFAALRGRLSHRLGEYNAVQKVFYWGVLAAIVVTILSGLSIWKPVQLQWLTALFGGYQSARVVHFFGMAVIVAFLAVHLALTALVPRTLVAMVLGHAADAPHRTHGEER